MIEVNGLNELVRDLTTSPRRVQLGAAKAVTDAARKGAEEAKRLAPRHYLSRYAETITHEAGWMQGRAAFAGEFGPERRGQGNLGAILEEGTAKTPPHAHIGPAFDRTQRDFLDDLGRMDYL